MSNDPPRLQARSETWVSAFSKKWTPKWGSKLLAHHNVEVGGIEPPSGHLPSSCSEHILPAQSMFLVLPYTTSHDRSSPEKCVISVSVCQFCVR
jgi:hypothetical protein